MSQIELPLHRIKVWLQTNAPRALSLNPPATDGELRKVRVLLGAYTPPELLELYAIHNGATDYGLFADGMEFMTVAQVMYVQRYLAERGSSISEPRQGGVRIGPVKPIFFSRKRVAFAAWNGKVHWSIDYDPAPGGVVGQIVYEDVWADHLEVISASLPELLSHYADDLERGVFVLNEEGYLDSKRMFWPNYACSE